MFVVKHFSESIVVTSIYDSDRKTTNGLCESFDFVGELCPHDRGNSSPLGIVGGRHESPCVA